MPRKHEDKVPVTSVLSLIEMLDVEYGQRKYQAYLHHMPGWTGHELFVREYFDDGKGHSGAFTEDDTPVEASVFEQAKELRYITGLLKPGYVSEHEFKLSDDGRTVWDETMCAMRVLHEIVGLTLANFAEIQTKAPYRSHQIERALQVLVRAKLCEKVSLGRHANWMPVQSLEHVDRAASFYTGFGANPFRNKYGEALLNAMRHR